MDYLNLNNEQVAEVAARLNTLLSTYQVHYQKLRNFHWNLTNKQFFVLHVKFEELYTEANTNIDDIAERILSLRNRPFSKMSDYLENSAIEECSYDLSDEEMVTEVLSDYKQIIKLFRDIIQIAGDAGDEGTADMLIGFLKQFEKNGWMLSAWLNESNIHNTRVYDYRESGN
jgi:starvation-inducible DNA-binding protein